MKRLICLLLSGLLLLAMLPGAALAEGNPVPEASKAVVGIVSGIYYQGGEAYTYDGYYGTGTGFGVGKPGEDAQIFVTNCHVVTDDNGNEYDEVFILIDGADITKESTVLPCKILTVDRNIDLAVIQANKPIPGVTTLPLRSAKELPVGEKVYALGYPGVAEYAADVNDYSIGSLTATDGMVSRHLTSSGVQCMAHTAAINHGNSGGPLIDGSGNVVGINTFMVQDPDTSELRGYAIYIDYAMEALEKLGLDYTLWNAKAAPKSLPLVPVLIGAGVLVVLAVVVFLLFKRKPKRPQKQSGRRIVLQAAAGPLQGMQWELTDTLNLGREPSNSIVLPAQTKGVSRCHCRLQRREDRAVLTDLGSSYGTFVNGSRLAANLPTELASSCRITLGSDEVAFNVLFMESNL